MIVQSAAHWKGSPNRDYEDILVLKAGKAESVDCVMFASEIKYRKQ